MNPPLSRLPRALPLAILQMMAFGLLYLGAVRTILLFPAAIPPWITTIGETFLYFLVGFLTTYAILQPVEWHPLAFLLKGARRFLPAYYLSILLITVLVKSTLLLSIPGLLVIAAHLLMLHPFVPMYQGVINEAYGIIGNIAWFVILMVGFSSFLRTRAFWVIIGILMLVSYGWQAWLALDQRLPPDLIAFLAVQLPAVLNSMVWGAIAAWIVHRPSTRGVGFLTIVGIGLLVAGIVFHEFMGGRTLMGIGLMGVAIGISTIEDTPLFTRLLSYTGISFIIPAFFSFLLYYEPILYSIKPFLWQGTITSSVLIFGIITGSVLIAALGSYHLVEKRF
jgi:hypothetical protein